MLEFDPALGGVVVFIAIVVWDRLVDRFDLYGYHS